MILSVEIPDAVASQMRLDGAEGQRRALEKLALEGYRSGELSRGQVSELLGQAYDETEAFLKAHGCGLGLSLAEHQLSVDRLRKFLDR